MKPVGKGLWPILASEKVGRIKQVCPFIQGYNEFGSLGKNSGYLYLKLFRGFFQKQNSWGYNIKNLPKKGTWPGLGLYHHGVENSV